MFLLADVTIPTLKIVRQISTVKFMTLNYSNVCFATVTSAETEIKLT